MFHHSHEGRRISARTPLFDHAGQALGTCTPDDTLRLIQQHDVIIIASKKRILGLRFFGPDPAHLQFSGSHHKRQAGMPHRNENYFNLKGVWHLDRIPDNWRRHYHAVVADCHAEQSTRMG